MTDRERNRNFDYGVYHRIGVAVPLLWGLAAYLGHLVPRVWGSFPFAPGSGLILAGVTGVSFLMGLLILMEWIILDSRSTDNFYY